MAQDDTNLRLTTFSVGDQASCQTRSFQPSFFLMKIQGLHIVSCLGILGILSTHPPWWRTSKNKKAPTNRSSWSMHAHQHNKVTLPRAMGSSNTSQTRGPHFEKEPNLTRAQFTRADWATSLLRQAWAANISACKDCRWWHPTAMITAGAFVSESTGAAHPLPILSHDLVAARSAHGWHGSLMTTITNHGRLLRRPTHRSLTLQMEAFFRYLCPYPLYHASVVTNLFPSSAALRGGDDDNFILLMRIHSTAKQPCDGVHTTRPSAEGCKWSCVLQEPRINMSWATNPHLNHDSPNLNSLMATCP